MVKKYTDNMGWEELVDTIYLPPVKDHPKINKKKYRDWLLSRSYIKEYCVRAKLMAYLYLRWVDVTTQDSDCILLIVGKERFGKSSLALLISYIFDPEFSKEQMPITLSDIAKLVRNLPKNRCILIDEAVNFCDADNARTRQNQMFKELLVKCGQRNLFFVLNMPKFEKYDSYLRQHRCDGIIHIPKKCKGWTPLHIFNDSAIDNINHLKRKNVYLQMIKPKPPMGFMSDAHLGRVKQIPKLYDKGYLEFKKSDLKHTLNKIEEESKPSKSMYISLKEAMGLMKLKRHTYVDKISKGEIRGKKVGNKWFVLREDIEK